MQSLKLKGLQPCSVVFNGGDLAPVGHLTVPGNMLVFTAGGRDEGAGGEGNVAAGI